MFNLEIESADHRGDGRLFTTSDRPTYPDCFPVNSVLLNIAYHQDVPTTEETKPKPIEDSSPESAKIPLAVADTLDATIVEDITIRRKRMYLRAIVLVLVFVVLVVLVIGFVTGGINRVMKPKKVPLETGDRGNEEDEIPIIE